VAPPSEGARLTTFERTPIHPVLYRVPVYLGVPRTTLKQEGILFLMLCGLAYGSWLAFAAVAVLMLILHGQLARACRDDVRAIDIFLNALQLAEVMVRTPPVTRPAKSRAYWRAVRNG
jgi:type IV secretory pathway VirB3-like protein